MSERRAPYAVPKLTQAQLRQASRQPTEAHLQRDVVTLLEKTLGYVVMQVGKWVHRVVCPACGHVFVPHGGFGNTKGCPDLYIAHPTSGNTWRAVELKAPGAETTLGRLRPGKVRPEQQTLIDLGVSVIGRSVEEVVRVVEELRP